MDQTQQSFTPAATYHWLTPWYDSFLRWTTPEIAFKGRLLKEGQVQPGHRVLDLGCGTGTFLLLTKKQHCDADLVGLDADARVLTHARRKLVEANLNVTLDQGLATQLPYPDNYFDRVFSSLLLHHLCREDKRRAMAEVRRVLRPGGQIDIADFGKPHNIGMRMLSLISRRGRQI
jgi:ubiquinone/menaquinone biosynthesis C-methylase UbiE